MARCIFTVSAQPWAEWMNQETRGQLSQSWGAFFLGLGFLFLGPNPTDKAPTSVLASFQIKATDSGQPPLSATVRLHIEWIPQPRPSSIPLAFDESHYSFTVMETDPVNHMVGVISVEGRPGLFWFSISGEGPRRASPPDPFHHPYRPALILLAQSFWALSRLHSLAATILAISGDCLSPGSLGQWAVESPFLLSFPSASAVVSGGISMVSPVTSRIRWGLSYLEFLRDLTWWYRETQRRKHKLYASSSASVVTSLQSWLHWPWAWD